MSYKINDNCINCDECYKICPNDAISLDMIIDPALCDSCGACGRVCPVAAIVDDKGRVCEIKEPEELPAPSIDDKLCTGCQLCIENCPTGALALTEPTHMGDYEIRSYLAFPKKCIACGMCESTCPVKGITMKERKAL